MPEHHLILTESGREALADHIRIDAALEQREWLCDGRIVPWRGASEDVFSPVCIHRNGGVQRYRLGSYPLLSECEALRALDAACAAYDHGKGLWPTMSVGERIAHIEDFTARMIDQREIVVKLLMWEIGKTLTDSIREFDRTVEYIRDTINALKELDRASSRFVIEQGVIAQIRRAPLGVVLCMGPFNYPLNETFTTLIPALIMGNTVIFKPPKLGVLLHQPLLEAFRASFPPGVVNTVYGDGQEVIGPLMKSGRIDVLAFIGSSRVAGILKQQHPRPHRLRSILGLEAKNAAIILKDADLTLAVSECITGALSFNGQRCTALKMLFVHEDIAETFLQLFTEAIDSMQGGFPWTDGVQLTALPEHDKTQYLTELIQDACSKGADVINRGGGDVLHSYMTPALLYPVGPGMRLYSEEQFGPLIPVASFKDIQEPLAYVTESNFGQQLSLFGRDAVEIAAIIDPMVNQVCRVNINSQCQRGPDIFPFTGRKDSAEGTLSVSDALRVFAIRTLVAAKASEENKHIINSILRERRSSFLSTDFIL
jgi:glyceraldehyde-3-phosphate dehydrogenase (NADP+)